MGKAARVELVDAVRARYGAGSRGEKRKILDELIAVTGLHRKHAIRVLTTASPSASAPRSPAENLTIRWCSAPL